MKGYWVYKHFNKENECIYVGVTMNMIARHSQHKKASTWYNEINRIEYCNAKNKKTMEILEVYFINKIMPKYNKKDKSGDDVAWMDSVVKDFEFIHYSGVKNIHKKDEEINYFLKLLEECYKVHVCEKNMLLLKCYTKDIWIVPSFLNKNIRREGDIVEDVDFINRMLKFIDNKFRKDIVYLK